MVSPCIQETEQAIVRKSNGGNDVLRDKKGKQCNGNLKIWKNKNNNDVSQMHKYQRYDNIRYDAQSNH